MKNKKGISLIVLVITIIVLAILAATVIISVTNSGIINSAKDSVNLYELSEIRSMASAAWAEALIDENITTDDEYDAYVKEQLANIGVDVSDYEISASASGVAVDEKTNSVLRITATTPNVIFTKADGVTPGDINNLEKGDIVIYGDYEYRYNVQLEANTYTGEFIWSNFTYFSDGWSVILREESLTKTKVGDICNTVFGKNVVSAIATFANSSISKSPKIPKTIICMDYTFLNCVNLVEGPELPEVAIYMYATFKNCNNLTSAPVLPEEIEDLRYTFEGCSKLLKAPKIPERVNCMLYTFSGCSSLEQAPVIPELVGNMEGAFANCTDLTGTILIKAKDVGSMVASADETGFDNTFLNVTKSLVVKVPDGSLTHDKVWISYNDTSNIIIEPYAVED